MRFAAWRAIWAAECARRDPLDVGAVPFLLVLLVLGTRQQSQREHRGPRAILYQRGKALVERVPARVNATRR
jgi:hypothetical protein